MKVATKNLIGPALDWAVGMCERMELSLYGVDPSIRARVPGLGVHAPWRPSSVCNQGGPIMDRLKMDTHSPRPYWDKWLAYIPTWGKDTGLNETFPMSGPTRLIAAMRCYVFATLGDEVEIPDELCKAVDAIMATT